MTSMFNTPDSPAKTPAGYTTQGGNFWTLITPEIWKVLHAVLHQRDLNAASCINHEYYIAATMFLSQYVHTYPLSLHQLMHFRAGEPGALHLSSMPLQYSMPFLAKAIEGMVEIFPEGKVEPSGEVSRVLRTWLMIAENGVTCA
jgi:hypothetical protein